MVIMLNACPCGSLALAALSHARSPPPPLGGWGIDANWRVAYFDQIFPLQSGKHHMTHLATDFVRVPYCVYAHYVDDVLVYIGSGTLGRALAFDSRGDNHRKALETGAARVDIWFRTDDRDEAYAREASLIALFKPMYNIASVRGGAPLQGGATLRDRRPVRCIETGVFYYTAVQAATEMGLDKQRVVVNTLRGRPAVDGYNFERVDWAETDLDPDMRLSTNPNSKRMGSLSPRAEIILDAILYNVENGHANPTHTQLAGLAHTTESNVSAIVNHLVKRDFIRRGEDGRYEHGANGQLVKSNTVEDEKKHRRINAPNGRYKLGKRALDVLTMAAKNGEPCPTNADIAAITGIRPQTVAKSICALKRGGFIRVEKCRTGRIIHIGDHSTLPTANHNVKGVATVERKTRAVDWIIV